MSLPPHRETLIARDLLHSDEIVIGPGVGFLPRSSISSSVEEQSQSLFHASKLYNPLADVSSYIAVSQTGRSHLSMADCRTSEDDQGSFRRHVRLELEPAQRVGDQSSHGLKTIQKTKTKAVTCLKKIGIGRTRVLTSWYLTYFFALESILFADGSLRLSSFSNNAITTILPILQIVVLMLSYRFSRYRRVHTGLLLASSANMVLAGLDVIPYFRNSVFSALLICILEAYRGYWMLQLFLMNIGLELTRKHSKRQGSERAGPPQVGALARIMALMALAKAIVTGSESMFYHVSGYVVIGANTVMPWQFGMTRILLSVCSVIFQVVMLSGCEIVVGKRATWVKSYGSPVHGGPIKALKYSARYVGFAIAVLIFACAPQPHAPPELWIQNIMFHNEGIVTYRTICYLFQAMTAILIRILISLFPKVILSQMYRFAIQATIMLRCVSGLLLVVSSYFDGYSLVDNIKIDEADRIYAIGYEGISEFQLNTLKYFKVTLNGIPDEDGCLSLDRINRMSRDDPYMCSVMDGCVPNMFMCAPPDDFGVLRQGFLHTARMVNIVDPSEYVEYYPHRVGILPVLIGAIKASADVIDLMLIIIILASTECQSWGVAACFSYLAHFLVHSASLVYFIVDQFNITYTVQSIIALGIFLVGKLALQININAVEMWTWFQIDEQRSRRF